MHPSPLSQHLKALLLPLLLLSSPLQCFQSPTDYSQDFGRIIQDPPREVLHPKTPQEISILLKNISSSPTQNNITVSARGAGHSTDGQSQALGGIVIDMQALPRAISIGKTRGTFYVDAAGGVLWIDVLKETLKQGLAPRSWTDYLYLTVGGTLSNAGISGQAFKYGPQISNVLELDVITGKGEQITCSKEVNSELFYGVLGGLGQFGIITRARIVLHSAPKRTKRVLIPFKDFDQFTRAQELLISMAEVDYLEGLMNLRPTNNSKSERLSEVNVDYMLDFATYYDDAAVAQKTLDLILSRLAVASARSTDVSYFDFLTRGKPDEAEEVPHPWLNFFVPRDQIRRIKDLLIKTIPDNATGGLIIMYPTLKDKWDLKMSAMIPQGNAQENIMYVVSVLRAAPPSCISGSLCLESYLEENQKIIETATFKPSATKTSWSRFDKEQVHAEYGCIHEETDATVVADEGGIGAKQYLPFLQNEREWGAHFGDKWERFKELKSMFDPLHILSPGQRIFRRKCIKE